VRPEKLGTSREIAVDGGEGLALGLQSYPRTLALADHEVVLTFDDGPVPPTTPLVLSALKEQCVRATFFIIGNNASADPALVKREMEEGHSVGYHSNSHPGANAATDVGGRGQGRHRGGDRRRRQSRLWRRFGKAPHAVFPLPGFADSPALLDYLRGRGMTVFGSDLWASDWRTMTPQAELDLVMGRLEQAGKGIILFHDSKASTAKMLPDFLRALKAKGFKVVHMVAGAGPTPVEKAGPDWKSTTEPIIAKTLGGKGPASEHGGRRAGAR